MLPYCPIELAPTAIPSARQIISPRCRRDLGHAQVHPSPHRMYPVQQPSDELGPHSGPGCSQLDARRNPPRPLTSSTRAGQDGTIECELSLRPAWGVEPCAGGPNPLAAPALPQPPFLACQPLPAPHRTNWHWQVEVRGTQVHAAIPHRCTPRVPYRTNRH